MQSVFKSGFVQRLAGFLLASYMVLVKYTTRWQIDRADQAKTVIDTQAGLIALTWHSRFLMLNAAWKKDWQPPHVLISRSRDGTLVSHTTHYLGLKTIRGSARKQGSRKSKGGAKAMRDMLGVLKDGACVVMTPDGPRGPRQRLGDGPLYLAKISGSPILPCTFAVKHRIQFKSWDRFVLPLPFGRGRIIWGSPVYVPASADNQLIQRLKEQIETEMNRFLADADMSFGHVPTEPLGKT